MSGRNFWHGEAELRATLRAVGEGLRRIPPLVAPLLLLACHQTPSSLAVVGNRAVTIAELGNFITAQTGKGLAEVSPELAGALFERYLEETLILAASPERRDRDLPAAARSARARDLLISLCAPPPQPTDAEVDAYLAWHPEPAASAERLRLRQLILPDQTAARRARDRVRLGEDFGALSRELSRAPNAADGGLIGWVERGQLPPEFEAAVFSLTPGDVSEPVASNAGWHVFQVMERRSPSEGDPGVRTRARAQIATEVAESARRTCLHDLAARVGVQVDCVGATFPCHDPFEGKP